MEITLQTTTTDIVSGVFTIVVLIVVGVALAVGFLTWLFHRL